MRLTIHANPAVTAQLTTDLTKLYGQQPDNLQQQGWFVATFNDRHIAALFYDGEALQQLAVRQETRRRGVGRYLLEQALKALAADGVATVVVRKEDYPATSEPVLAAFLQAMAFDDTENGWRRSL